MFLNKPKHQYEQAYNRLGTAWLWENVASQI